MVRFPPDSDSDYLLCQPLFKAVATLWRALQDEMVVLSILDGMVTHLQPFLSSQAQLFSAGRLDVLLEGSDVKTDEDRMAESSGTVHLPLFNHFLTTGRLFFVLRYSSHFRVKFRLDS